MDFAQRTVNVTVTVDIEGQPPPDEEIARSVAQSIPLDWCLDSVDDGGVCIRDAQATMVAAADDPHGSGLIRSWEHP
jgi:hypothetical protein